MRQLLYVSHAPRALAPAELDRILATSRAHNALMGITGLLLFLEDSFLQILEGEERALRDLYSRITADRRHAAPQLLLDRAVAAPGFRGWSMGFERPSAGDPETAGLYGVARDAAQGRLSPAAGKVVALMLETFYRVHRGDDLRLRTA